MDDGRLSQVFYRNVKTVCRIRKIRIGDVEKMCGLCSGYISRWKARGMPMQDAVNVSEAIGFPLQMLITESLNVQDIKNYIKEEGL